MKRLWQALAVASLIVCAAAPIQYFRGAMSAEVYKDVFLAGTVGWFVFAGAAFSVGRKTSSR